MAGWNAPTTRAVILISAALLCAGLFLSNSFLFLTSKVETEPGDAMEGSYASYGGMATDIRQAYKIDLFQKPVTLCGGILKFTSAFCDSEGFCRMTGIGKWRGNWEEQIRSSTVEDSEGTALKIAESKVKVHYVGDNHRSILDAFVLYFELSSGKQAEEASMLHVKCSDKKAGKSSDKLFPIAYRQRIMNDHIVLIVSQFYSAVDLPWVEMFLKHYLQMGVDVIALYTGFSPQSQYSEELNALINKPEFANSVVRFEWSDVSGLQSWSHSQTSMINHGVNLFLGSTIISSDLDEIVIPAHGSSIRPVVDRYNEKYGSWGFNILSYTPKKSEYARLKNKLKKFKRDEWNWKRALKRSKPCSYPPSHPSGCRAKWIFHSLEPDVMRIHVMRFGAKAFPRFMPNTTHWPGTWLDPNDLAMVHMRSIQGVKGLSVKYKNGTVVKYDADTVRAINSGLGAIHTDNYINRKKEESDPNYEVKVVDSRMGNE